MSPVSVPYHPRTVHAYQTLSPFQRHLPKKNVSTCNFCKCRWDWSKFCQSDRGTSSVTLVEFAPIPLTIHGRKKKSRKTIPHKEVTLKSEKSLYQYPAKMELYLETMFLKKNTRPNFKKNFLEIRNWDFFFRRAKVVS